MNDEWKYDDKGNYSPQAKAVLELINHLIERYGFDYHELDCFDEHECERPL